jgi:hypothetical protein
MAPIPAQIARTASLVLVVVILSACTGEGPATHPATYAIVTAAIPEVSLSPQVFSRESAIPAGAVKMSPETDPSPPVLHSDEWLAPVPMPGPVDTAGAEDSPFITPDGRTFLFFYTPDAQIPAEKQLFDGATGIYMTERVDGPWAEPWRLVLQDPGKLALDGCEFLLGQELWFCSAREGNFRDIDLWLADLRQGVAGNWRNAGERINRELRVGEMHLSSDGATLYFHARGPAGNVDLFLTRRIQGGWSDAEPMTALNSDADEGWPFVSEDGFEFWFTRTYEGTPGIFRSLRTELGWSGPSLILSTFAGEPTLDRAGNLYFVHHYVVDGKIVEADIYVATHR